MNPLKRLQTFGQSVYMDESRRSMIASGYLRTLIERDGATIIDQVVRQPSRSPRRLAGRNASRDRNPLAMVVTSAIS